MCESLERRFWSRVDLGLKTECWEWRGAIMAGVGYGKTWLNGRSEGAHRVAYHLATGVDLSEVPTVLHACDNRLCCNPAHLSAGTQSMNHDDMVAKGRHPHGETHGNSKLTWDAVREIRRAVAAGESRKALAARFGVDAMTVGYVIRGETWKENVA
jgi:HNH endonuclease